MAENKISGQVTERGDPVENAVVIATRNPDFTNLNQSSAFSISGLAKLTDQNGEYKFTEKELAEGIEEYHIIVYKKSGERRRGKENHAFVSARGSYKYSGKYGTDYGASS